MIDVSWAQGKQLQVSSTQLHVHRDKCLVFLCVSYRFPLWVMIKGCLCKFAWWLFYYCANLCWFFWTQVHGSVVRAVDSRSAGPWFNSGWRSWFTFVTCSDNPMNQISQMFISKSPITRKSVKKIHNECKMIEGKNEDNVTLKKIRKRRDDDLEQSSSSANALRNASSYWKHIKQQQQYSG